jgi:hypothetical protein
VHIGESFTFCAPQISFPTLWNDHSTTLAI